MKKVKFRRNGFAGKGVYLALCMGMLAVGAVTAVGYRAAVGSLTRNIIPDINIQSEQDDNIDTQVDKILPGIEKTGGEKENNDTSNNPNPFEPPFIPNLTDELQTLYYEQAKMFPVAGEVLNEYSWGELTKAAGGVWRTHDGVDIAAEVGENVKSMTSGTVTSIYSDPLWGNCVVIDHGETVIGCYYGLSPDISVNIGDKVSAGQVIGTVGNTADIESDLDSHIHFALKFEGTWIDPVSYIEPMK